MKRVIAIIALALASIGRADCREQADICMDAQVECVSPMTRTALFRCARFSTWCVRHTLIDCTKQEQDTTLAALRTAWWQVCLVVTGNVEDCKKLE